MAGTAEEHAPAKINLVLQVMDRGDDGYHAIRTLFCALELGDRIVVSVRAGGGITLEVAGADVGPEAQNLAVRAARAFLDSTGSAEGVDIRLEKRIPAGGGLGGGSSDAAATLRALDRLLPGRLRPEQARELAAGLGSDVPFFLTGHSLARGTGRGERLAPLPALPERSVVLALPPFGVPTAEAYRWLDDDREAGRVAGHGEPAPALTAETIDWGMVAASAVNDFEGPVFRRHPLLRALRDGLAGHGAEPALLAGSGSTVFGIFRAPAAAQAAAAALRQDHPDCTVVLTRTRAD